MSVNNTKDAPYIWYGDQNFSLPSHLNFGKFVVDKLFTFSKKIAVIDAVNRDQLTYEQLGKQVISVGASLRKIGAKPDDVIAICSENRLEYLSALIGIYYVGCTATLMNNAYGESELRHVVDITKPKYMFLSPNAYKSHFGFLQNIDCIKKFFVFGEIKSDDRITSFKELSSHIIDMHTYKGEDFYGKSRTALILYSSGTTGLPKGVKISHTNLIISHQRPHPCPRPLSVFSLAPWCNTVGVMCLFDALLDGKSSIFMARFEEKQYISSIQKYKPGMLLMVPPLVVLMTKSTILKDYDVSSVEVIHCGGAPLDAEVIIEAKKKFPRLVHVLQGYGMTELTGALTSEKETATKVGSVGVICEGLIIKIVDVETRKTLGANQAGELCAKGPVLFEGYYGKNNDDEYDEDGFFKTGDIAYFDEDGYFYIVDRIKELIKYKAWQVAPSELEALLLQHPAVKDAGVTGIPDPLAGELPAAFVVKKDGAIVTEKEILDYVASKISGWKRLRGGVRFVKEVPKTPSGKILRRKIRELFTTPPPSKL